MSKQYKKDYISEVIIKIDFMTNLSKIKDNISKDISKIIKKYFQIPEPRDIIGGELQISQDKVENKKIEKLKEWAFYNRDKTNTFVLNPFFMLIDYHKHEDFDNVRKIFMEILKELFIEEPNLQVKRFGLRYINNIEIENNGLTNWTKYIDKNLLSIFNFYENKEFFSRVLNQIEFNFEDLKFRFQSGMRNPDYPALIKRKVFVLDYDCYYEGLLDNISEVDNIAVKSHGKIMEIFEKSIKDDLRNIMNL